jgi:RES domain
VVVYRAAAYHTPLWVEPNVTEGRFHQERTGPVQYFCEHPLGPLAEALRRLPPGMATAELRRPVWALRLPDTSVETLGFDEAADWGIDPYGLVCPPGGYAADCQVIGETMLAREDPPLLRVPSAALPGTWNIVVFGQRVIAPYLPDPHDPTLDVPAAPAAVDARALEELTALVRPLEQRSHAAYDAWRAGEPYDFAEPDAMSLGG